MLILSVAKFTKRKCTLYGKVVNKENACKSEENISKIIMSRKMLLYINFIYDCIYNLFRERSCQNCF